MEKNQDGKTTKNIKFGLWEDGKRIEWFTDDMVQAIQMKREDYRVHFKNEQSSHLVDSNASFDPPIGFQSNVDKVLEKLKVQHDKYHQMVLNPLPPAPKRPNK